MEVKTVLLVVAAILHSTSASYHVLTANGQSELSEAQESFWSHSRQRRSLIEPDDIFNSLIVEDDYSGIGSGFEDVVFSRELTLEFFVKNADTENSARTSLAEVMPGNAILTDFNIHNQGHSYGFDRTKAMGKEDATKEYENSIHAGHSTIMVGDVKTADGRCANCGTDHSEESQSVSAVINIAPGDVLSVSLTYIVPMSQDSIEYQKDLYRTDVTIEVEYPATGFSGVIMSPNYPESYPNNADMTWLITVPPYPHNMVVSASLISFESESCCDHLYMYDGATDSASVLAVVSGESYSEEPFVTTGSSLLLKFQSDCLKNNGGFSLEFSAISTTVDKESSNQALAIHQNHGTVFSPGYPVAYPPSSVLTWTVTSDPDTYLILDIVDIDVLSGESLTIYDDKSGDLIVITTETPYSTLRSSGNVVSLTFTTKQRIFPHRGFYVTFSSQFNNLCSYDISLSSNDFDWKTLISPNYPNNYGNNEYCTWAITAPYGNLVRIEIETLDLESGYDILQIYDGNDTSSGSDPLATLSGSGGKSIEYITEGNTATIVFNSDQSTTEPGFRINYRNYLVWTGCSSSTQTIDGTIGSITNPNFPSYYYGYGNCKWLLTVSNDKVIDVFIERVNSNYYNNNFMFYDGDSTSDAILWSGDYAQAITFSSSSNQVLVYFQNSYNYNNFLYAFRFNEASRDDSSCGNTLTESPGEIKSPNYPRYYPSGTSCEWLIQAPTANFVGLSIEQLYYSSSYDSITFYDGDSTYAPILAQCPYNNCNQGVAIFGTSNNMLVTASMASSTGYFKFEYNFLSSSGSSLIYEQNSYSGYAISPNFPAYYPNYYSHVYSISVASGSIYFSFPVFQTESCCDHLLIYDGSSTSSPAIAYLSGSRAGYSGQTSGNYLTLYFDTDGSVTSKGFQMNYCANGPDYCSRTNAPDGSTDVAYSYAFVEDYYTYHYFASPGSASSYPVDTDFIWYIGCGVNTYQIYYQLYRLDIDSTDFIRFYEDFGTDSSKLVTTLSGINSYYSSYGYSVYGKESTVWFHSDSAFTGQGFYASYRCYT